MSHRSDDSPDAGGVMKIIVFMIGGGVSGIILSFSMGMKSIKELAQGFAGGAIAGLAMAMMLPGCFLTHRGNGYVRERRPFTR